jgi:ribonucleoside-diphosphate reductase beta chain
MLWKFFPAIKKADWALKWIESDSFQNDLIAFAAVEGIFFSGAARIYWLTWRNARPTFSNELIFVTKVFTVILLCIYNHHLINKVPKKELEVSLWMP